MDNKMAKLLNCLYFLLQIIIALGFVLKHEYGYLSNPALTSFVYLGILGLERYTAFKLKNFVRVLLIITLTSHNLFGEYFNAYNTTPFFDNALHLFGIFSFSIFGYALLTSAIRIESPKPLVLTFILAILLGISMGAVFELLEFALDILSAQHNQHSLRDTDLDLFYDAIGALSAGIFILLTNPLQSK